MRPVLAIFFLWPLTVQAEVFQAFSAPARVYLHADAALVERQIRLDLPAGSHQVRLSDVPETIENLDVSVEGATLLSRTYRDRPIPTEVLLRGPEALQAAKLSLEAAVTALAEFDDALRKIEGQAEAAEAQVAFLSKLADQDLSLDAAGLAALSGLIAETGVAARNAVIEARAEARAKRLERDVLEDAVTLAEAALARVQEPLKDTSEVELSLSVGTAQSVVIDLTYVVSGVYWQPVYEYRLNAEGTSLGITRQISVSQQTGEHWQDVELTVSSLSLGAQSAPGLLRPRRLRAEEPASRVSEKAGMNADTSQFAEPIIEAPVIVEEMAGGAVFTGAGVVYEFSRAVTIFNEDSALLNLAPLEFPAEVVAQAVPLNDRTAFRVVTFRNDSGERMLAGNGIGYLDGQPIGQLYPDTIEAGEEVELGFGPIHGLQLRRAVLDRSEGERGFIARENARDEAVRIEVENLTDRDWRVLLRDRVPFSEQDDLLIEWTAQPGPARENVEDKRGILEWDLDVGAGEAAEVILETQINWPEGMILK